MSLCPDCGYDKRLHRKDKHTKRRVCAFVDKFVRYDRKGNRIMHQRPDHEAYAKREVADRELRADKLTSEERVQEIRDNLAKSRKRQKRKKYRPESWYLLQRLTHSAGLAHR